MQCSFGRDLLEGEGYSARKLVTALDSEKDQTGNPGSTWRAASIFDLERG